MSADRDVLQGREDVHSDEALRGEPSGRAARQRPREGGGRDARGRRGRRGDPRAGGRRRGPQAQQHPSRLLRGSRAVGLRHIGDAREHAVEVHADLGAGHEQLHGAGAVRPRGVRRSDVQDRRLGAWLSLSRDAYWGASLERARHADAGDLPQGVRQEGDAADPPRRDHPPRGRGASRVMLPLPPA
eukprot:CAMPEP_0173468678 /NCGR_PEP_ID=MMETSP1357-20121228/76974_1 /TAXON_ID=77926 /ORGANISM="Hemiselmis rufescens, Strain PCC563" /LENGTH=185 /DNA_ID=CAMNT_0014436903 /DNA_START=1469 /DNA_END=2023 /DNA_ORIENTATION=+